MPFITIDLFEGRTIEAKRELVKSITAETSRILACSPDSVHVRFNDVKREDWSTGGTLWSDKE
ncbi:MAG TPA: 4-oxalocrotonate tautomerase [Alcaligenaceae bacterium]|nr:4-oxalocrotonate tautomerase [Alcaligenaceae bacterium]